MGIVILLLIVVAAGAGLFGPLGHSLLGEAGIAVVISVLIVWIIRR